MSPLTFLRDPYTWLRALALFRASVTGVPNFALDVCAAKVDVSPARAATLDLSCVRWCVVGAEPVRYDTLRAFSAKFAPFGLDPLSITPAYGLAEATLMVSIKVPRLRSGAPATVWVDAAALQRDRVVLVDATAPASLSFVCCGAPVQPVALRHSGSGQLVVVDGPHVNSEWVGHLLVRGPSVTRGYWGVDRAPLQDGWFETGDAAFSLGGELFICGRIKDMLIVRGRKLWPQDLELSVEQLQIPCVHVRKGCVAAVSCAGPDGLEHVALLVEVRNMSALQPVDRELAVRSIAAAVAREHGVRPLVELLAPHSLSKTSSGKLQRWKARQLLEKLLHNRSVSASVVVLMEQAYPRVWTFLVWMCGWLLFVTGRAAIATPKAAEAAVTDAPAPRSQDIQVAASAGSSSAAELELLLTNAVAAHLQCSPSSIDVCAPFMELGLDSRDLLSLGSKLPVPVAPAVLFDHPSIRALAAHLGQPRSAAPSSALPLLPTSGGGDARVAVVGMGLRLPGGVSSTAAFWAALVEGRDLVTVAPPALRSALHEARGPGGWLEDVASFVTADFGMDARAAAAVDPLHRLLLECAREALADSGCDVGAMRATTGVCVGVGVSGYAQHCTGAWNAAGLAPSMAANRISSFWAFQGPSVVLDTACSSSLVAVHDACEWIRSARVTHALAGGANLCLVDAVTTALRDGGFLSPTGRCRAFSVGADGYVRGEGAALLLLSCNADTESYGVLQGWYTNHNGAAMSLVAPKSAAQEEVIRGALASARMGASDVDVIEAHGSGTPLGDAIELDALSRVLSPTSRVWLTTAKSHVGHLEAAAGVVGLIKALLGLGAGAVPGALHVAEHGLNAAVAPPICVSPTLVTLEPRTRPYVCGVSSFGFGGTNAHVVAVQSRSPKPLSAPPARVGAVVCWSGLTGMLDAPVACAQSVLDQVQGDPRALDAMHRVCGHFFAHALARSGVVPQYARLAQRMREWLALVEAPLASVDLPALAAQYPEWDAEIAMLQVCGPQLGLVLAGAVSPLELLFPNGDATNAQRVFSQSPLSAGPNAAVAALVCAMFEGHRRVHRGRPFVVFEVGAGTGGTTEHVLAQLHRQCAPAAGELCYTFTDVSPLFVAQARAKFSSLYPSLAFAVLDVERTDATRVCDLVLAANVVHATRDVHSTVRRLRQLSRAHVVLLEITRPHPWLDATFGLTEQWWSFGDDPLRCAALSPLLDAAQWRAVLDAHFAVTAVVSSPASSQSVLVASSGFGSPAPIAYGAPSAATPLPVSVAAPALLVLDEAAARAVELTDGRDESVVCALIRGAVAAALDDDAVQEEDNLLQLGMDSLMALSLRSALSSRFPGVELPVTALTTEPTVRGVSRAIVEGFAARRRGSQAALVPMRPLGARAAVGARAAILAVATASPPHCMAQAQLARDAPLFYRHQPADVLERLVRVYANSDIDTRYSVLPDWSRPEDECAPLLWRGWRTADCPPVGVGARNAIYVREAPRLAVEAAQRALASWGGDVRAITHVVSVSCTGTVVPGIEFRLVQALGLSMDVERLAVNFMGCFAGIAGLRCARSLAESQPGARVLLVCTELCTLHFEGSSASQPLSGESIVASAIFADGAAACVVGCDSDERALWIMEEQCCRGVPDSVESMAWELGDSGWRVGLAADIPMRLADAAAPFVQRLLGPVGLHDAVFALHPGGSAIVRGLESMLGLEPRWQTAASWDTLRRYGNMSSCTVLFVLARALERAREAQRWDASHTLVMAFGPGLSIEGVRLRNGAL